ncbi:MULTISPECIES: pyroglutamyl-peptidase I [unclassified Microbacterium]|uniref:pyroglutamyl-peptidase I n=1 Tax=unclassified Microbacterium TaxID=2609290 RepID=UPI0008928021|nr:MULTISPECIES: pyroglutamyl-peptidase I [unclassified Microbacterium]AOX45041.1 pyroglutamyl-peptidase I [Microbacterium sp. BH-3-3-3]MBD8218940.1 pyroglutamyl-peptidase I [Microbacterium sp. CFBP 13617]
MTTVLLTGFEPFAGDATNPSGDAVRAVSAGWSGPEELIVEVLPVTFDRADAQLRALIDRYRPDVVIATGLAGGRTQVTPERVAINLADARIPDNDGAQPVDRPIVEGAPAAYFATVPVKAMAAAMGEAGIPAAVSYSAGTFVCNQVMFAALHATASTPGARAGFVHVPYASEDAPVGAPSLPLADIVRALESAVRAAIDVPTDLAVSAGTLH